MNWNSKDKTWSHLVSDHARLNRDSAIEMRREGVSVRDISIALKLSKSRIYELLKLN